MKPKPTYYRSYLYDKASRPAVDGNAGRAETSRACLISGLETDASDAHAPHRYEEVVEL